MNRRNKKRLVLLDAHAIIHRAYHALPDFTGPKGEPTGALYGLVSMLLRIIGDLSPDYLVACYDLPKPTIRHEAYAAYKATRAKTDDALVSQIIASRRVFEAFCVPIYEREGFEADDILGTIAYLLKDDPTVEVIIASGDMDTLQLVEEERVKVYTLKKGLNDTIMYDATAVKERYGFLPTLIPDWKGLRGDPSDNIKGVPGIGEKTATDLVREFGTLEHLYKTLKKNESALKDAGIRERVITLLKEHEEGALFSKNLATIRTDAPIAFALSKLAWHENGSVLPGVLTLFDELGFRSLRDRAKVALTGSDSEENFGETPEEQEEVPEMKLAEAKVMLWLLASDFTNPSLDDIIAFTTKHTFAEAYEELAERMKKMGKLASVYKEIEHPLIDITDRMKQRGVLIDEKALHTLATTYRAELANIAEKIYAIAGHEFNVSSPKQLGVVLFDELALRPKGQKKTSTGQRSTRESELEKIQGEHPIVPFILEYRELLKLLSTYIESIPPLLDEEKRLHATFLQAGTTTGRMASQGPNLQNIPIRTDRGRAIRKAFIVPKNFTLLTLDYSQIELRIAAILSKDEKLSAIFKSGRDVHREVASAVFNVAPEQVDYEMRRRAKIINFGILYGMGVNALRTQLGTSTGEAHQFYEDYFGTFTTLAKYLESVKGFARKHGYTETLFGRRRQFPEMKSSLPYVRAQAERMAINAPIQGTQADIIKLAMVRVDEELKKQGKENDAHLLLQVHDELVYEIADSEFTALASVIKNIMESVLSEQERQGVPILVESRKGKNWGDLETL